MLHCNYLQWAIAPGRSDRPPSTTSLQPLTKQVRLDVSKRIFNKADSILFSQLKAWAEHRHPNKSSQWSCQKYWQTIGLDNWVFTSINRGIRLLKHRETPIVRHTNDISSASTSSVVSIVWFITLLEGIFSVERVTTP